MASISSARKTIIFLAVYVAIVLPLCFLGYGSDNDTYGVLEAGKSTWRDGHLATSRNPGYWLYEGIVYAIAHLGGYVATNVASMCAGAFILWRFLSLCRKLRIPNEYILGFCVLFVPTFLIAASSTIDYLWSLAFLVATAELLLDDRLALASLTGAIAVGFRASNSIIVAGTYAGLLIYGIYVRWGGRRIAAILGSGFAAAALGALFFLPSWIVAHGTLGFLTPGIGPAAMWTFKMHAGRFIYKTIYLFGPIATIIMLFLLVRNRLHLKFPKNSDVRRRGFAIALGAFLANIALFAKFPVEVSYLLPSMFFFMLLAGLTFLNDSRTSALLVLGGILTFNLFSISFAKPNVPLHATNATLTVAPQAGILIEDIRIRLKAKSCETVPCWAQKVQQQPAL